MSKSKLPAEVKRYFEKIGAKGGSSTSEKKAAAARLNGLKRKKTVSQAPAPVIDANNRSESEDNT